MIPPSHAIRITTPEQYAELRGWMMIQDALEVMSKETRAAVTAACIGGMSAPRHSVRDVIHLYQPNRQMEEDVAQPFQEGDIAYLETHLGWCRVHIQTGGNIEEANCSVDAWTHEDAQLRSLTVLRHTLPPSVPTIDTPVQWQALDSLSSGRGIFPRMPENVQRQTVQALILTALGRLPLPSGGEEG